MSPIFLLFFQCNEAITCLYHCSIPIRFEHNAIYIVVINLPIASNVSKHSWIPLQAASKSSAGCLSSSRWQMSKVCIPTGYFLISSIATIFIIRCGDTKKIPYNQKINGKSKRKRIYDLHKCAFIP